MVQAWIEDLALRESFYHDIEKAVQILPQEFKLQLLLRSKRTRLSGATQATKMHIGTVCACGARAQRK